VNVSKSRSGIGLERGVKMLSEDTTPSKIEKKEEETRLEPIYVTCWTGAVPDGCRLVFLPILHKETTDKGFAEQREKIRKDLFWMFS
jgi:hypothetical protein